MTSLKNTGFATPEESLPCRQTGIRPPRECQKGPGAFLWSGLFLLDFLAGVGYNEKLQM